MTSNDQQDLFEIPKVDLEHYNFSPPGSMGWSATDYERILNHPEAEIQEFEFSPPSIPLTTLKSLPSSPDQRIVEQDAPEAGIGAASDNNGYNESIGESDSIEMEQQKTPNNQQDPLKADSEKDQQKEKIEKAAEKQQSDDDNGYIKDPYPPASPWLSKIVSRLFKKK
ncbi:hypothetical protein EWI07_05520 [Sporolactobacillus sp. THM7-4]|nr:hypothetical protein EWI07_05520 [Sporolactobacillus sp. THM7-4]